MLDPKSNRSAVRTRGNATYAAVIEPHPALVGPFAILLLSIAIFPLILRQHWERHLHIPRPAWLLANVAFLFGGSILANFIGTIGAAIAESRHVPAPGFLAYIIRYALPILVPVLALVGLIFFRG